MPTNEDSIEAITERILKRLDAVRDDLNRLPLLLGKLEAIERRFTSNSELLAKVQKQLTEIHRGQLEAGLHT